MAWGEGATLWKKTWKRATPWLLFAGITEEILNYWVEALQKLDERFMVAGLLFTIGLQLLISGIGVILINQIAFDARHGKHNGLLATLKANIKYVFIETTRALLPIILKLFLFIIPGLIEMARLYFVPFVVQFDGEYKEGKVDALERSRALSKGSLTPVILILLLANILSILPRLGLMRVELSKQPGIYIGWFLLAAIFELYGDLVIFTTYERLHRRFEEKNGPEISLQRSSQS